MNKNCCGFGFHKEEYKFLNVVLSTYFTGNVPMKLRVKGLFPSGSVLSLDNTSNLHDDIDTVRLETKYNNTFIKVIDITQHNLNPNIIYPIQYLLSLPSIESNPSIKNYSHDIIFNVYNYLQFINKHQIEFIYDNLIILANCPNLDNAFWNGSYLTFGSGVEGHTPLTSSMIVGHELTHAVIQSTCNLDYEGHSGALNESICDVYGTCFEFYVHEIYNSLGWELGSETGFLLRNMKDPHACMQPEVMYDSYYMDPSDYHDNGGVHINSGIPNHIFYQVQEIIGHKKAFELWIRVMHKLTKYSNFKDFKTTLNLINTLLGLVPRDKLRAILDKHIY